jgi:serine/threonine protein kinase
MTAAASTRELQVPELEGFAFVRPIGSGGFSDVLLYEQLQPRRLVAVKVFVDDDVPPLRSWANREADIMARVAKHPFVVDVLQTGETGTGRSYIVMPFYGGPTFAEIYKRQPMPVRQGLQAGIRLAGALSWIHSMGVLHRDVKPGNVLTTEFGTPGLTDFGIAGVVAELDDPVSVADEHGSVGMSVPWAPPEMFDDEPMADVRSDVYSLAATIYTLLAGRTPFESHTSPNHVNDLVGRILRGVPTPFEQSNRLDVPQNLTNTLIRGMATDPNDRPQSAAAFGRDLQDVERVLGFAPTPLITLRNDDDPSVSIELAFTSDRVVYGYARESDSTLIQSPKRSGDARRIFLVHGRDLEVRQEVRDFVDAITGSRSIVLADEPSRGMTIIEKFERFADATSVAIVLMTPDDQGSASGGMPAPRARQNVIFEMGYFMAKLGRANVIAVNAGVERPSDIEGLVYIGMTEDWKTALARELRAAGIEVPPTLSQA